MVGPNVQSLLPDLRKKLLTNSGKVEFAEADMSAVQEAANKYAYDRLHIRSLVACAGLAIDMWEQIGGVLFSLGMGGKVVG